MHKGFGGRKVDVALNELLKEVKCFNHLGSKITVDGRMKTEVKSRINDVRKVLGGMKEVFSCKVMGMNVKRRLYEGIAFPTALYGVETWRRCEGEQVI